MKAKEPPKTDKRKILVLTQYFPPVIHTAAQRTYSFYKHLNSDKFSVSVVAPFPDGQIEASEGPSEGVFRFVRLRNHWRSPSLVNKSSGKLRYYLGLFKNLVLSEVFLNEDPVFTKQLVSEGESHLSKEDFAVLLTSHGPMSVLLAGWKIKRKNPDIYWVCDMRDELSTHPNLSWWKRPFVRRLEKKIWEQADLVLGVSAPILGDFKKNSGNPKLEFLEVKNGSSFVLDQKVGSTDVEKIKIGYFGSFYGGIKPANFFQALSEIKSETGRLPLSVDIYGHYGFVPVPKNIEELIHFHKAVPYERLQSLMASMDIFLLIGPRSRRKGVYTSKLFDYLFLNRPILGLVPQDDVAAQLIRETRSGRVAPLEQVSLIKKEFTNMLDSLKAGVRMDKDWSTILEFSRENQVKRLEAHLNTIFGGASKSTGIQDRRDKT